MTPRHAAPADDGIALLREAWDGAADGYEEYFAPRFRPWLEDLVERALTSVDPLPPGPVLVTCCGPGLEVELLARALPRRTVVGIDLSPRMIELTRRRTRSLGNVRAEAADASTLTTTEEPVALLVSAFGLQQMPDPPAVLAHWTRALHPRGAAHVLFWPSRSEDEGPFAVARDVASRVLSLPRPTWEARLTTAVEEAGGVVACDTLLEHTMGHESAERMWTEMSDAGPWRALRLRFGDDTVAELRRELLARLPVGPIRHRPRARLLQFGRRPGSARSPRPTRGS